MIPCVFGETLAKVPGFLNLGAVLPKNGQSNPIHEMI